MIVFFMLGFMAVLLTAGVSVVNMWFVLFAVQRRFLTALPMLFRLLLILFSPLPIAAAILFGPWSRRQAAADVGLWLLVLGLLAIIDSVPWLLDSRRSTLPPVLSVPLAVGMIVQGSVVVVLLFILAIMNFA